MKRLLVSFLLLCAVAAGAPAAASSAARPNIIVILADDMGYSDLGCFGSEIPTPHLDALAAGGVRFSQFYDTGRCCPTRASLLTGLYPHQAGVGHMTEDRGVPGYRGRLNATSVTLAEVLRSAGYFTAMAGKWHVGHVPGASPWTRGFERSLNAAAGGFYYADSDRAKLFLNGEELPKNDPRLPKDWYSTDLWTTFGLKFIDEALAARRPFFVYLAHNAPHFPLQAPADAIAKFRGKYRAGWDALRAQRLARQQASGLIDPRWKMTPRPEAVAAWESLSAEERDRFDHLMAVYAATVHRLDQAVGDLVAGLKQRGQFENTLILFLSDNGGNAESGPNGRDLGDPTRADSTWFCGESWAYLQNTPFRLYKHYNHEGGIAAPFIAHWPAAITARNQISHQPAHLIDVMATCLDVSRATYPEKFNGQSITRYEGTSLLPAFHGKPLSRPAPLFFEHEGNRAIREGQWKLVAKGQNAPWELYDMNADRTETSDLGRRHPHKVRQLSAAWDAWAKRAFVVPGPAAAPGKKKKKKAGE